MGLKINIGCGRTPIKGWRNFDNSPSLKLAKSPVKYTIAKRLGLINKDQIENVEWNKINLVEYADATKKLPLPDCSVIVLYSSHMLEHLSRSCAIKFLKEAKRVLATNGIIRIAVPDLERKVLSYLNDKDADDFMENLLVTPPPILCLKDRIRLLFTGYRHHQWMYDGKSLSNLLSIVGFKEVKIQDAGETLIQNPGNLNLYERLDESIYVEGKK